MNMIKLISGKNAMILVIAALSLSACKKGGLFGKKHSKSSATGWNYDDKNMGNFHVSKVKYPKAGPGLVFVQGGSFVMGAKDEDVMGDWNNVPRRITVPSFFIDETEVANVHYREYLYWLENTFSGDTNIIYKALPDTLVWREELAYNEPYVEYYFRFPSYNYYPVVGVSWRQAHDFCIWRTDRVNELNLQSKGYLKKDAIKREMKGAGADGSFNTETYLMAPDMIQARNKPKKSALKDVNGKPRSSRSTARRRWTSTARSLPTRSTAGSTRAPADTRTSSPAPGSRRTTTRCSVFAHRSNSMVSPCPGSVRDSIPA
jgi:gliding motility-associated lipoprotein GldJ